MRRMILSKINPKQRDRIETLCKICCQAEPIRLSLPLPKAGDELSDERFFALYDEGRLVSLIHLFYPDHMVGELIGFTHPEFRRQGYFKQLLSLAADYGEEIGLEQIYLISDGNSKDAQHALSALGLTAEYSEYMLGKTLASATISDCNVPDSDVPDCSANDCEASDAKTRSVHDLACPLTLTKTDRSPLTLTKAARSPLTAALFSEIFQTDIAQCEAYLEEISSDSRILTYVLQLDNHPIGQTQLTFIGDMAYVSGFGILPEYRRQGYGLQFLQILEQHLAKHSIATLTLQVSDHNKNALSLYRKDGFETLEALHYYPLFEEA